MLRRATTDGLAPREGLESAVAPAPINPSTGQHEAYWILSAEERAKGFVRPVRARYIHLTCGAETTMRRDIAETYAREPTFYGSTFCTKCLQHLPVGAFGEFVWRDTDERVGT